MIRDMPEKEIYSVSSCETRLSAWLNFFNSNSRYDYHENDHGKCIAWQIFMFLRPAICKSSILNWETIFTLWMTRITLPLTFFLFISMKTFSEAIMAIKGSAKEKKLLLYISLTLNLTWTKSNDSETWSSMGIFDIYGNVIKT